MSRGEIVSSEGAGLYRVRLKYAVERVLAELERVNKRIAELAVLIPEKKLEVLQAEEKADDLRRDIDLLIDDYRQAPDQYAGQISDIQVELAKQTAAIGRLRYQRDVLIAENLSLLKRRNLLEAVPESKTVDAWCADFTEELSGDVGLADLNDEGGRGVIIQPGFSGDAGYDAPRDGSLFPDIAQSAPQLYFNLAILPGVQKWRPGYRLGTISDLNGDACTVTLDDAFSSAQNLDINQQAVYQSVPIQYMDCNGAAFEDGDRVLVRFTDSGPLVIGFEREPVQCSDLSLVFWVARYELELPEQLSTATLFGQPYEDENGEINPPIGTANGPEGVWQLNYRSGEFNIEKGLQQNYGYRNWIGEKGAVLSWSGPPTRVYDAFGLGDPATEDFAGQPGAFEHWRQDWAADQYVYFNGNVLWAFNGSVHGAAFYKSGAQQFLIAVLSQFDYRAEVGSVVRVELDEFMRPLEDAVAEELFSFDLSSTTRSMTDWYFSRSGDRAVCTARDIGFGSPAKVFRLDLDINSGVSSSELWDRETPIGSSTKRYVNVDESFPSNYKRRVVDDTLSITSRFRPVYVEYIGDDVVQVNQKLPSYSRSSVAESEEDQVGTGPYEKTYTRSESSSASSAAQIVTDQGKTLATAPFVRYSSISVNHQMSQFQEFNTGRVYYEGSRSETVNQIFSVTSDEVQVVAIDARFDFCVIWSSYTESNYSVSSSEPVPDPNNQFIPIWDETRSGPIREIEKLSVFFGGQLDKELPLVEPDDSTSSTVQTSAWPSTPQGFGTSSFTETYAVLDDPETFFGSRSLLWGAGYKANGKKAWSIVYHQPLEDGSREPVWFSQIDGYGDVISDLLEQDPAEGFVLDRLSIQ
ncbi:MAG TPA: hypothetical protein DEP13_09395 [Gammaproteobacteria bacterium]|nr:hypothetical protein [Gammaproteobacteria bacterium]